MTTDRKLDEVPTWRQRIGVGQDYQLHGATDVERAMVAEIAELRALLQRAPAKVGPWIVIEGQRIKTQNLVEQQLNAERYEWLREKADSMVGAPMVASLDASGRMVDLLDGEDLDQAMDAAMARRPAPKPRKAHRNIVTRDGNSLVGSRP